VDSKQQLRKRLTALEDGGIAKLIGDCWRDGWVQRRVSLLGERLKVVPPRTTLTGEVEAAGHLEN